MHTRLEALGLTPSRGPRGPGPPARDAASEMGRLDVEVPPLPWPTPSLLRFAAFWVPALVAGAGAAAIASALRASPWLALFVLAVTANALVKGMALVFERPRRPRCAASLLLAEVALPVGVLAAALAGGVPAWLAAGLALLSGAGAGGLARRLG